jgi:hypothetical protein
LLLRTLARLAEVVAAPLQSRQGIGAGAPSGVAANATAMQAAHQPNQTSFCITRQMIAGAPDAGLASAPLNCPSAAPLTGLLPAMLASDQVCSIQDMLSADLQAAAHIIGKLGRCFAVFEQQIMQCMARAPPACSRDETALAA